MTTNNKTIINYDESKHEYTNNETGNRYRSVTEIASSICNINKEYLESHFKDKRVDGSNAHSELARYYDPDESFEFKDFTQDLAREIADYMLPSKDMKTEIIVWNPAKEYAGTIDLVIIKGTKVMRIIDFKTMVKPNKKYCTIQLSLYKLALESMGYDCSEATLQVINPSGIIEYEAKTWEEIMALEKSELVADGKAYIENLEKHIADLQPMVDEYNELQSALKAELLKQMESAEATNYFGVRFNATYVAPNVRISVDSKKLKTDFPEAYESCKTESKVSGFIKLTQTKGN